MQTTLTAIERLQVLCSNPILPTAYSESLSYIQQLACFSDKLNEVIERLNEFTTDYEGYVQEQLAPYNARLSSMETRLDTVEADVSTKIRQLTEDVETAIKDAESYVNVTVTESKQYVDNSVENLTKYVNENIGTIEDHVQTELDATIKKVETYVTGKISEQLTTIFKYIGEHNDDLKIWVTAVLDEFLQQLPKNSVLVINPITGVIDTLQNALNALANACKQNSLNCNEWDALLLTAEQFDNKIMTAYTIDWMSREKLLPHKWAYMYSPFNGQFVLMSTVINDLANFHKDDADVGAITAADYDAAQLTANAYEHLSMTAYEYDWHARRYIKVA